MSNNRRSFGNEDSVFNMPELNLKTYVTYICGSKLIRMWT